MKILASALIALVSMAIVAGCGSTSEVATTGPQAMRSLLGNWTLDSIGDKSFAMLVPQDVAVKKPTLDISADGKVSGFAGVNRLMSSLNMDALAKGGFAMSPAATTMMAGPEYAMKLERQYLDALAKVRSFKVEGSKLTLTDGANQIMQFVRGS